MKTYIAKIADRDGSRLVGAEGPTKEIAKERCLAKLASMVEFDVMLDSGIKIPGHVEDTLPSKCPQGYALVCFERCSHNCGDAYEWRWVAVLKGEQIRHPDGKNQQIMSDNRISFLDSNSDYCYELPPGSYEWYEGTWIPVERMKYHY